MAGRGGFAKSWRRDRRFEPSMDVTRARKLAGWRDAVQRTLSRGRRIPHGMMPVDPPEQGEFASLTLIALGDTPSGVPHDARAINEGDY